jgi:hypothetical protein
MHVLPRHSAKALSYRTFYAYLHQIVLIHEHASTINTVPGAMTRRVILMASLLSCEYTNADLAFLVFVVQTVLRLVSMSSAILDVWMVCVQGIERTIAGAAVSHPGQLSFSNGAKFFG